MTVSDAEKRVRALIAIAKALIEAANDFGEGNQIGGDVWALAEAVLDARDASAATTPERPVIQVRSH